MPTREARTFRAVQYVILVVALLLFFGRTESQDRRINHLLTKQATRDYQDCLRRQDNVARLNTLYAGLVRIETDNPFRFTSPSTVQRRIALFTQAQLEPPTCRR